MLLAPVAALYKLGIKFRNTLFDKGLLKSERFDIPIICIGNITVGGTGKTPMAELVIDYMSQMHNVALLSRGYATNRCRSNASSPIRWSSCAKSGRTASAGCGRSIPRST